MTFSKFNRLFFTLTLTLGFLAQTSFSATRKTTTRKATTRKEKIASSKLVTDKESSVVAPEWNLSGGVILGSPTGFVLKDEFDARQAVDFGLSYSFSKMFVFYGDWQYRFPNVFRSLGAHREFAQIEAYAGVGLGMLISSSSATDNVVKNKDKTASLGILFRIPLGLQYRLEKQPVAFFVELVPGMGIIPGTFGYFGAGIGARYYF